LLTGEGGEKRERRADLRITAKNKNKHKVYIISLRHMQSTEGPQQGAACLSDSPVVPIRGVSTGRMRKWSRWMGVSTVKQRLSGALARLHGARHETTNRKTISQNFKKSLRECKVLYAS